MSMAVSLSLGWYVRGGTMARQCTNHSQCENVEWLSLAILTHCGPDRGTGSEQAQ